MIHFRTALPTDADAIARVHTLSWQKHYRGILTDQYLDHDIQEDRLSEWRSRMQITNPERYTLLAESEGQLCGFACTFLNHDPEWGAYMDNLHVLAKFQGKGIGRRLIQKSAQWVFEQTPDSLFYLWVWAKNTAAKGFYESIGAECHPPKPHQAHDGQTIQAVRCVWRDLNVLKAL